MNNIDVSHFRLSVHLLFAFIILSLIYWNYLNLVNLSKIDKKINNYIPEFFLLLISYKLLLVHLFQAWMQEKYITLGH